MTKSLDSLKKYLCTHVQSPSGKGKRKRSFRRNIVTGDLVELEGGDVVVADGRILDNYSLQVNESALTGEIHQCRKDTRQSAEEYTRWQTAETVVYSGSLVTLLGNAQDFGYRNRNAYRNRKN